MEAPPPSKPFDIFLSHSGKQKGFVIDLETKLSSMGYSVFLDKKDDSLPPAKPFPNLILSAANSCKIGIVVLSDDFFTSRWPMVELCAFTERHGSPRSNDVSAQVEDFSLLPLFYKLSPEDMKRKEKVEGWVDVWKEWELRDGKRRMTAEKCKKAVSDLSPLNGIVLDSSRQGDVSYIEEVANKIRIILRSRPRARLTQEYVGIHRLCDIILDEFRKLDALQLPRPSHVQLLHSHFLGMYGVPGSGKSTLCRFLCDQNAIFHEFGENVIYLELPTNLNPRHVAADSIVLCQQYLKLIPRHTDSAALDLDQARNRVHEARIRHKMFLVLDNISPSNQDSYRTLLQDILSSPILLPGSKVMLVAQSQAILEDLMSEVQRYSTYRHAIVEVPCMTEEEAIEIIRNRCHSCVKDDGMLLPNLFKRNIPSSMYIPFVFEQIGVLLKDKDRYMISTREITPLLVEQLSTIVSEGTKGAVQKLVHMNFQQLPEELQVLFFDIALFIIPAGYSEIDTAALILSRMNGAATADMNAQIVKMKILELRKHCSLSIIEEKVRIHDIFMEYAKNIPVNSTAYVNATWSSILDDAAPYMSSSSAGSAAERVVVDLKCSEARTINIGDGVMNVAADRDDINLHLEIGAKAKAVIVRSSSVVDRSSGECSVVLSGDMSSLVYLQIENVDWDAIGPNLSSLDRLELRKQTKKKKKNKEHVHVIPRQTTSSGKKRKRTSSSQILDILGHPFLENGKGMYMSTFLRWLTMKPWGSPWRLTHQVPSYKDDVVRRLARSSRSGIMARLRVLILVNPGVRRLENIGQYCPRLEDLQVSDEHQELMLLSIGRGGGSIPKLKRLIIAKTSFNGTLSADSFYYNNNNNSYRSRARSRSKLELQLGECRELQEVLVDVCSFDRVDIQGPRASEKLRHFGLINDRSSQIMGMSLIPPCSSLSLLRKLEILCNKVETLHFPAQHFLPSLEVLRFDSCNSLTHVSAIPSQMPNLQSLFVVRCNKLQAFEGLEGLVKQQLQKIYLAFLPQLRCHLVSSDHQEVGVPLKDITVRDCPGVKISDDLLASSKKMKWIDLQDAFIVSSMMSKQAPVQLNAMMGGKNDLDFGIGEIWQEASSISRSAHHQMFSSPTISLQNRWTFQEGQLTFLEDLRLDGSQQLEHLQEIHGIEHLRSLRTFRLSNLRSLTRISGTWPPSITSIYFYMCPMLQEVPRLEHTPELKWISCIECVRLEEEVEAYREEQQMEAERGSVRMEFARCDRESMDSFEMEDVIDELGQSWDEESYPPWFTNGRPHLNVCGSKIASVEAMEEWLVRAQWNSHLSVVALQCLSWEYVAKGASDALDALFNHFSALSPQIIDNGASYYHENILKSNFSYSKKKLEALPSAFKERLSRLKHIMVDTFGVPVPQET